MMRYVKTLVLLCILLIGSTSHFVDAFGGVVTSIYGNRIHPIHGKGQGHHGVDIGVPWGVEVPSLVTGTVVYSGWLDGYGNYIAVMDAEGVTWAYGHLEGFIAHEGDHVTEGQIIAIAGSTGDSTGPHLHVERRLNYPIGSFGGQHTDPLDYLEAKWDLTGGYGDYTYGGADGIFEEIFKFRIYQMDWQPYFTPSQQMVDFSKTILEKLTNSFSLMQSHMMPLLVSLMILDLIWYCLQGVIFVGPFSIETLLPKLLRYSVFVMLFKSWDWFVKNLFIPMFEGLSSLASGQTMKMEDLLSFDLLFTTLSENLGQNLMLKFSVTDLNPFPFFLTNILVFLILFFAIGVSVFVLSKIAQFYLICSFGVLGLPISLIPGVKDKAGAFIGAIMSNLCELLLVTTLFGVMLVVLKSLGTVAANSIPSMFIYTLEFMALSLLIIVRSEKMVHYFNHMQFRL